MVAKIPVFKIRIFAVWMALSMLSIPSAWAGTSILYVYDGDSVRILQGNLKYTLRIRAIDAPERNQSYGKKARRALMQFCQAVPVEVVITGQDRYRRHLGDLYCNQQSVSAFMVANGHAWHYGIVDQDSRLADMEMIARQQKKGLWQQKRPTPPWKWRQRNQNKNRAHPRKID